MQREPVTIAFTTFADDIGAVGQSETRRIVTTLAGYRSFFGHNAPSGVNFARDWVVFYSAGVKSTGGYGASIDNIGTSTSGRTLKVTTSLKSPGSGCAVTMALTKPYVLAKFRRPAPRPYYVSFYKDDVVYDCSGLTNLGSRRLPNKALNRTR